MRNLALARTVVSGIQANPASLRMSVWAVPTPQGIVACLAGHTLLAASYKLTAFGNFYTPSSSPVRVTDPGREAKMLLEMSDEEYALGYHYTTDCNVFCSLAREEDAFSRFLELTGKEELVRVPV